jgi:hypothetical protein
MVHMMSTIRSFARGALVSDTPPVVESHNNAVQKGLDCSCVGQRLFEPQLHTIAVSGAEHDTNTAGLVRLCQCGVIT